ncbi:hypothetical protein [Geobacter benzoatilyticus]|uniref:Uncharacterized protein n=1 Tax=Geobacter benzoatilyticus TaxID=2815309 RepID=A0ABX7Q3Y3_9BACT|nr:hypothetical protein [Geobacter benzoatilyticus]QSV46162.1 hypothetical protein JZM60_02440 [Geobacter benzoatilyticus]
MDNLSKIQSRLEQFLAFRKTPEWEKLPPKVKLRVNEWLLKTARYQKKTGNISKAYPE